MSRSEALPLSPTHGAALAHIADLRAEAERRQLVQAVSRRRRGVDRHPCVTC